jgi:hypothetical protein
MPVKLSAIAELLAPAVSHLCPGGYVDIDFDTDTVVMKIGAQSRLLATRIEVDDNVYQVRAQARIKAFAEDKPEPTFGPMDFIGIKLGPNGIEPTGKVSDAPLTYFFPTSTIDQCIALVEKAALDARAPNGLRVIVVPVERKRAIVMEAISKMLHGSPIDLLEGDYLSIYDREKPKT